MNLINTVYHTLNKMKVDWSDEHIVVGVSGGLDSLVLLHSLHELQPRLGYTLQVATFDHRLRGAESAADVAFVKNLAKTYDLPISVGRADVRQFAAESAINLEAAARQARYTFFAQTALELDAYFLAVGHHRDDQIETLLMHLLRGTGLSGLRGMLPASPLTEAHLLDEVDDDLLDFAENLTLLRPLLEVSRAEIAAYAQANHLTHREDSTNADVTLLRNRLRQEVLPLLETLNPNLRPSLARMATIVQGDYEILEGVIQQKAAQLIEWDTTLTPEGAESGEVAYMDRQEFLTLGIGLQRQLVRHILFNLTPVGQDLPYHHIESACEFIAEGKVGQQLSLPAEVTLHLGYDELIFSYGGDLPFPSNIPHLRQTQVIPLEIENEHVINGRLKFYSYWVHDNLSQDLHRPDPLEATLCIRPEDELTLRTRRDGDRFSPLGMQGHSQKLADVFTNLKIPKLLRDRVPLLLVNNQIAWFVAPTVQGIQGRIAQPFAVQTESETVLRVRWELVKD